MTKIFNTFGFDPKVDGDFTDGSLGLVGAEKRGNVFIENGVVTVGEDIINQIKENPSKDFLVNKTVFEFLAPQGVKNICMWDKDKTQHIGSDTFQGGVIFP